MDPAALAAEFPPHVVSWRCQTISRDGNKGLALAYIDARDVMRRLDEVCTPAGWQDRYEVHGSKTLCYLSLRIGDVWITKADGAGDTDVEAEKGSLSDAFKRAAVKWGIGRYLYDVPAPWVPCEIYEAGGKKRWSKWTTDPWSCVRQPRPAPQLAPVTFSSGQPRSEPEDESARRYVIESRRKIANWPGTEAELRHWWTAEGRARRAFDLTQEQVDGLKAMLVEKLKAYAEADRQANPMAAG